MSKWLNQLHQGDSIKLLQSLPESERADLVFADPPYNIGFSYDVYDDRKSDDEYLNWSRAWMKGVHRALKPDGSFWLAIGDEYVAELKQVACEVGFQLRSWVIWYYTFGVNCKANFSRSHTHLLYFTKDSKKFTFNHQEIRVPSARQLVYRDARAEHSGRLPDNTWILRPQDMRNGGFLADHDTWFFPRVAGTFKERAGFHGCQMPEQLLGRIIRCSSPAGGVVLDPFAGSGSTLLVAKKLGRSYLGFELSAEYVRLASDRIHQARMGDPLEGPADPLSSAPATQAGRSQFKKEAQPDPQGMAAAFEEASDGYSVDRLIADPVLNAKFIDACGARGLAGRPRDWNLGLVGLRKSGELQLETSAKRTDMSWDQLDPLLFASEIALRKMLDAGYLSVDEVLCDPTAAARFDDIARSLAPGHRTLQYRWAALRLRKDTRLWQRAAGGVQPPTVGAFRDLSASQIAREPDQPCVYEIFLEDAPEFPVYVGDTINLRSRLAAMEQRLTALEAILKKPGTWRYRLLGELNASSTERRGVQSLRIAQTHPALNFLDLGAAVAEETAAIK